MKLFTKKSAFVVLLCSVSLMAQNFLTENKFSHNYHITEEEVSCNDCHTAIDTTSTRETIGSVEASSCTDCHEDDIVEGQKLDVTFKDNSFTMSQRMPKGKLFFSHAGHLKRDTVNAEGKKCTSCHGSATEDVQATPVQITMASCVSCHEEQKAPLDCRTCHPTELKPVSHKTGMWGKGEFHGSDAVFNRQDCATCHKEEDSCIECHMGMNGKKVHGFNYEYTHGLDVKFKRKDCATCHQPLQQFCGDCHLK